MSTSAGGRNLRIPADRIGLYGTGLALIGAASTVCEWMLTHKSADFGVFRSAALLFGTRELLAPGQMNPFVYLPAFAGAYVPFTAFPEAGGAIINAAIMLSICAYATYLAARIYRIPASLSFLLVFAWSPVWSVIVLGQNAALGLICAFLILLGRTGDSLWLEGLALGALLYKPQYALPFIVFALMQRRWRTLGIVTGCAMVWYVASAVATGFDWGWPLRWLQVVRAYAPLDAAHNAPLAVGFPTVLFRLGMPENAAIILGVVLLIACAWKLRSRPPLEALSVLPLIGLATSAHAWEYDSVLALPAIFWTVTHAREPGRTWLIAAAYLLAPFWLLTHFLAFDTVTVIVIGGALLYLMNPAKELHAEG